MAYQPPVYPPQERRGLGVTALILGIAAIITLVICGLGVVVAVVGIVIGIIAVVQNNGRSMAVTGLALSALTLIIAIGAGVWFFTRVSPCTDRARYPTTDARNQCLEHRVPFFKATSTPGP
jgi:ABC-type nickel/cobalt efflux system permease component RcnA